MKKAISGLMILTAITAVSFAGPMSKGKKEKAKAKSEKCDKAAGPACCLKKVQA